MQQQAIKNGVFDIFANSFFVEASMQKLNTKVDLSKQKLVPISKISKNFYDKDYSKKDNKKELEELKKQDQELINNLMTIEHSLSWNLTKPFRKIKGHFKK